MHLNIVTTSKAPVPSSVALVTTSDALVTNSKHVVDQVWNPHLTGGNVDPQRENPCFVLGGRHGQVRHHLEALLAEEEMQDAVLTGVGCARVLSFRSLQDSQLLFLTM